MSQKPHPARVTHRFAPRSPIRVNDIRRRWFDANGHHFVTISLYVILNVIAATLEQRADALSAWESWLHIHFSLLLPTLCLVLALDVSRSDRDPFDIDSLKARYGKNRRTLVVPRLLTRQATGLLVNLGTLLLCRTVTYPTTVACFDRDLLTCVGISVLATITYIAFFGALTKVGLGRTLAIVALVVDLTLSHAEGAWSLLVPQRHVTELLGTPGIFVVSAFTSSVVLIVTAIATTVWIVARTHR